MTEIGHYEIGVPFKDKVSQLLNNIKTVLDGLKKRLTHTIHLLSSRPPFEAVTSLV